MTNETGNEATDDLHWRRFLEAQESERPNTGKLLTYRDLFGQPPYVGQLADRIKSLDTGMTLRLCAWWQVDLAKFDIAEMIEHGRETFLSMTSGYPEYETQFKSEPASWSGKLTVTMENLARLAIALCLAEDGSHERTMPAILAFFECILIINDCLVYDMPDAVMRHFAAEFQTAATILRNEESTAYRYVRFLDFARERFASNASDVDVDALYVAQRGESIETHESVAVYLLQWVDKLYRGNVGDEDPVISFDYGRLTDVGPARSYLKIYSWTRNELRISFGKRPLEDVVRWWYAALLDRPLVQISREKIFCPSPTQFRHSLVSMPYFGVFNAARKTSDDMRLRVTEIFAAFFERYVVDLMEFAAKGNSSIVFPEQKYFRGKQEMRSPDCMVWNGSELLLLECQAGFPTFDLLVDMNHESLVSLIQNMIVKKALQLAKRIQDFRLGLWSLEGVPSSASIIPLVIHPHALPRSPLLNLAIERQMSTITGGEFDSFDIVEVEALESIVSAMKNNERLLTNLLHEKAVTTSMRSQTFSEFLHAYHSDLVSGFQECSERLEKWNEVIRSRVSEWNVTSSATTT